MVVGGRRSGGLEWPDGLPLVERDRGFIKPALLGQTVPGAVVHGLVGQCRVRNSYF